MTNIWTTRAAATGALLLAVTLTGCTTRTASPDDGRADAGAAQSAPEAGSSEPLLRRYELDGMATEGIIDHLDRLGGEQRPGDLMASVRPRELVLSAGKQELALDIPDDRFYLSVAPYVDQTHECFYHSLTTCKGELASEVVGVKIVDETNDKVLFDERRTTFENGFVGFWLPRGIEGTMRITYDRKAGQAAFTTDDDAPTCLTTLQLA